MERSEFKRLDRRENQNEARSFAKDLELGEGFAPPATPFYCKPSSGCFGWSHGLNNWLGDK